MNQAVLLTILLFSLQGHAALPDDVPDSYCDDLYYNCSPAAKQIAEQYFTASAVDEAPTQVLFVGSCYMVNGDLAPDHEHHGYVFLQKQKDLTWMSGEFSFFAETNPYLNLTLEELSKKHESDNKYLLVSEQNRSRVIMNEDPPWLYFMRQKGDQLFVVGLWGIRQSLICQMSLRQSL